MGRGGERESNVRGVSLDVVCTGLLRDENFQYHKKNCDFSIDSKVLRYQKILKSCKLLDSHKRFSAGLWTFY